MYPMRLQPTLHTRVWGGRRLAETLAKALPTADPYGESWELHDSSVVLNGAYSGHTLGDLTRDLGAQLIGTDFDPAQGFPLLAKFLDAADWLSIQVHPNDAQAAELEGEPRGKTEAWVILEAEPDARLVIGIQPGTPHAQVAHAITTNTLESLVVYADVRAGDVLYIPAGTIHAIGPGLLIYEIQQSCDLTYRMYDWGRMGLDGQPRPLHIEKSLKVANLATLPAITHPIENPLVAGAYFITHRHELTPTAEPLETLGHFHALTCIHGDGEVHTSGGAVAFQRGETILIPAALGAYSLRGEGIVLRSMQA